MLCPYLLISINELLISINELLISINELLISIISFNDINKYGLNVKTAAHIPQPDIPQCRKSWTICYKLEAIGTASYILDTWIDKKKPII